MLEIIVKLLEKEAKRQGYSEIRLNIDFDKLRSFYQELGYREMLGITNFPPHIATYRKSLLTGGKKRRTRRQRRRPLRKSHIKARGKTSRRNKLLLVKTFSRK